MNEYFIVANSFAAPFFSDSSEHWIKAESPEEALNSLYENYKHPCGLFAAVCYKDANAKAKGIKPLKKWLCNHEIQKQKIAGEGGYSYRGNGPGDFEINGVRHIVNNPKEGMIL